MYVQHVDPVVTTALASGGDYRSGHLSWNKKNIHMKNIYRYNRAYIWRRQQTDRRSVFLGRAGRFCKGDGDNNQLANAHMAVTTAVASGGDYRSGHLSCTKCLDRFDYFICWCWFVLFGSSVRFARFFASLSYLAVTTAFTSGGDYRFRIRR